MGGWPSFCKATESDRTPPSEGVKCLCIGRPLRPGSHVTKVAPCPLTVQSFWKMEVCAHLAYRFHKDM